MFTNYWRRVLVSILLFCTGTLIAADEKSYVLIDASGNEIYQGPGLLSQQAAQSYAGFESEGLDKEFLTQAIERAAAARFSHFADIRSRDLSVPSLAGILAQILKELETHPAIKRDKRQELLQVLFPQIFSYLFMVHPALILDSNDPAALLTDCYRSLIGHVSQTTVPSLFTIDLTDPALIAALKWRDLVEKWAAAQYQRRYEARQNQLSNWLREPANFIVFSLERAAVAFPERFGKKYAGIRFYRLGHEALKPMIIEFVDNLLNDPDFYPVFQTVFPEIFSGYCEMSLKGGTKCVVRAADLAQYTKVILTMPGGVAAHRQGVQESRVVQRRVAEHQSVRTSLQDELRRRGWDPNSEPQTQREYEQRQACINQLLEQQGRRYNGTNYDVR